MSHDKTQILQEVLESNLKRTHAVFPLPCKRADGVLASEKGKANILNKQYSSVFTKEDTSNIPPKGPSVTHTLPATVVTEKGVVKLLQDLDPHKASRPNNISLRQATCTKRACRTPQQTIGCFVPARH